MLNLTAASSSTFLVSSTTVMLVLSLVLITAAATDFGLYKLRGRGIMPSLILITGHIIRQIIANNDFFHTKLRHFNPVYFKEKYLTLYLELT